MSKELMITSFIPTKEKINLKAKDLLKELLLLLSGMSLLNVANMQTRKQAFTTTLMKKLDLSGIDGFLKRR